MKRNGNHHIYPKSRFPRLKNEKWNIASVNPKRHAWYHLLFSNKTPEEILAYINKTFWKNNFEITIARRERNGDKVLSL